MLPALSTATHSDADGHDMPLMPLAPLIAFVVHLAVAPSAGSELVTALPPLSEATQNDVDGHEIATGKGIPKSSAGRSSCSPSSGGGVTRIGGGHRVAPEIDRDAQVGVGGHARHRPPLRGAVDVHEAHESRPIVEVSALPAPSTATHSAAEVHEMPLNEVVPSTLDVSHRAAVPAPALAEPSSLPFVVHRQTERGRYARHPLRELASFAVSMSDSVHVADAP